jgi:acetate kinase
MALLVINTGSSSLKYELRYQGEPIAGETIREVSDYADAVEQAVERLRDEDRLEHVDAVVHRVVHGGTHFAEPAVIDDQALERLRELGELAPLHNSRAVEAIEASRRLLGPDMAMVATFDTTFHAHMPRRAASYALPRELAEKHHIRRYGFHGLAHRYMADRYHDSDARLITLQLGSGCSAAAIAGGRSLDTSMGLTPLEGLVMATRSGDVDPALPAFLEEHEGISAKEAWLVLNEDSGLKGVSGRSGDMRELLEAGDDRAELAIDLYCYRIRKYVGSYMAVLGGADALVFGGGVGENSAEVRNRVCAGMDWCGIALDEERNARAAGEEMRIDAGGPVEVWVMLVDEAEVMARDAKALLGGEERDDQGRAH